MKKYISPDLEFTSLLAYEDILTGSEEKYAESDVELDSDDMFEE